MLEELNQLLGDQANWNLSTRPQAEARYSDRVVEVFYDDLVPEEIDFASLRSEYIPLPSSSDSYRRVLLVGTTGSGKTTLLRQLLGSDRFPSTSTAKTTVADTEVVITSEGRYGCVVTFYPRDQVRDHLEECLSDAVLGAFRGEEPSRVRRRLLNHVNQRFRFSYVLGTGESTEATDDEADDEDDALIDGENLPTNTIDLERSRLLINSTLARVEGLLQRIKSNLEKELAADTIADQRTLEELLEENIDALLRQDDEFHDIVDELMDEIEKRFDVLQHGTISRSKQGWPLCWHHEDDNLEQFIGSVLRFSSNHARWFGTLLTPLVNGIRVAGPFRTPWSNGGASRLVFLDGEGLGHTPDSSASIPTSVSRRFEDADIILLVDNAAQPMQAGSIAVLRNAVSAGKATKLSVVFTHLDDVSGPNMRSVSDKRAYVLDSAENVLRSFGEQLGPFAERALRKRIEQFCFLVGGIHQKAENLRTHTKRELERLWRAIQCGPEEFERGSARPVYDKMNLILGIRNATQKFHDSWLARLGITSRQGTTKEHWTRVKALSRRFAEGWADEYDTLKPVADIHRELKEELYVFVQKPLNWGQPEPDDDEKQAIVDDFAERISSLLLDVVSKRLKDERIATWREAFYLSGRGSSFERASVISDQVYQRAAPVPDVTPSPDRNQFLHEVVRAVEESANLCGIVLQ